MSEPVKIGMIGLDTSHVSAFTSLLNDPDNEHHVPGGKVVVGFPGGSEDFEASYSRVEKFTAELRDNWGVEIVDSPEAVAERCELLFIESVDGRVHLEQFRKTVQYKRPTFIDKPFTVDPGEAKQIIDMAQQHGVPMMTASALRYAEALEKALASDEGGAIVGCDAWGPMAIQPTQPGLFWYGIHTTEVINAVMGRGCQRVHTMKNDGFDVVTGVWSDGRMATLRGSRRGHSKFGVTIHREQGPQYLDFTGGRPYYAGLLEAIMRTLPKGETAIDPADSLEIIRFIAAANQSRETGETVTLG